MSVNGAVGAHPATVRRRPAEVRALGGVRLIEVEPALGQALDEAEREEARRLVVLPAFRLSRGELVLDTVRVAGSVAGDAWGMLIVAGLLVSHLELDGHTCSRLGSPGELHLLAAPDQHVPHVIERCTIKEPAQVVLLDDRMIAAGCRWPGLLRAIHGRAAQTARDGALMHAISHLPRVEDRLLALLTAIAARRGIVRTDGVSVEIPLTHRELGQLIGARRPTVSLGLHKLRQLGLVRAADSAFLVAADSVVALTAAGVEAAVCA